MQNEKDKIKAGETENLDPGKQDMEGSANEPNISSMFKESSVENTDTGDTLTPNEPDVNNEVVEEPTNNINDAAPVASEEIGEENMEPQEKMLTQSQVNELVGRARQEGRESALKELYARYGVNGDSEMDDIFGKGQAYEDLNYDFENQGVNYKSALAENALLKSHIDENRWEDVKLILGGKGLEVNAENITALLPSHPEWRSSMTVQQATNDGGLGETDPMMNNEKVLGEEDLENKLNQQKLNQINTPNNPPMRLKKLGNEPSGEQDDTFDERKKADELFGFIK